MIPWRTTIQRFSNDQKYNERIKIGEDFFKEGEFVINIEDAKRSKKSNETNHFQIVAKTTMRLLMKYLRSILLMMIKSKFQNNLIMTPLKIMKILKA